jgi:hypothetical protein
VAFLTDTILAHGLQGRICNWRQLAGSMCGRETPSFSITEVKIMRKLMTTMLAGAMLAGLTMGMVGCTEETGTKEEVKIKGTNGTVTETRTDTIKKSGNNPPAAPSDKP